MERPTSVLPLGIALLMGAATFIAINPPPAMRLIHTDKIAVNLSGFADPCLKNPDAKAKSPACGATHKLRPAKPAAPFPPKYKPADPFWDRA
jgi:hypothetical protein